MTPRRRRLIWVLRHPRRRGVAAALALRAFQQNVTFYFDPSKIAAGEVHPGQSFRLGGMVEKGSVVRTPGHARRAASSSPISSTPCRCAIPRCCRTCSARARASWPTGISIGNGVFIADEVLAKHDEKYMPPPVARSLQQAAASDASHTGATGGTRAVTVELGHYALILALLLAAAQAFFGLAGPALRRERWIAARLVGRLRPIRVRGAGDRRVDPRLHHP